MKNLQNVLICLWVVAVLANFKAVTLKQAALPDGDCLEIAYSVAAYNSTMTAAKIDIAHGGASYVDGFCNFQKLLIQLNQSATKCYALKTDPSLKSAVEAIANNPNHVACVAAQALLKEVFNTPYLLLRLVPNPSAGSRLLSSAATENEITENEINISTNQTLQLYPNPGNSAVNVLLKNTSENNTPFNLKITNMLGQVVFSQTINANKTEQLDVQGLNPGIYLLSLMQNNLLIKETKLIIVK